VFQHTGSLVQTDFQMRSRDLSPHQAGLSDVFNQLVESRIRQIIEQRNSKDNRWKQRCKT